MSRKSLASVPSSEPTPQSLQEVLNLANRSDLTLAQKMKLAQQAGKLQNEGSKENNGSKI